MNSPPTIFSQSSLFSRVEGTFYRAVDPRYASRAAAGSRAAGRYSSDRQPTLYLSSSQEGVEAAMTAHASRRPTGLVTVELDLCVDQIFDLRDVEACNLAGILLDDAMEPWQEIAAVGGVPRSWRVRERIEQLGGKGLIDPSRTSPGLWHLVLFSWNAEARHLSN